MPQQKARFSRENSRDPPREFSTPGKPLPQPYHRSDVVADAGAGATSAQCVDRAVKTREWSPEIVWVVPSDRDRTYFRQNCSQEFLAGYLAAYRVEFRGQPGRSCGPWWRSSCRLWPRPSTWSRVECAWSTAPSRRAGPMPRTTSCGAASTAPPGSTPNWSACSTAPPSTSPTRCRDAPTMQKAFRHHAGRRECRALRWRDRG